MTLVLWVLTAIIYPAIVLGVGQTFFPYQADGSLLQNLRGEVVGSALIGQPFTSPRYFWSRPSSVDYSTSQYTGWEDVAKTGVSGASNLAPSNPELLKRIKLKSEQLQAADSRPTSDLVYASGSGLDPHITLEAAYAQVDRVADARGLSPEEVAGLINRYTEGRFLWIFGQEGVNVLRLNLALDILQTPR
jgi:K+-transporting ATPase ATPase C chain